MEKRQEEAHRKWLLRDLISRYNREKIYEEIWAEPIMHVAKRYSLSDVGLGKVCKKLKIPRPGLGYWAKKAAGNLYTHDLRFRSCLRKEPKNPLGWESAGSS